MEEAIWLSETENIKIQYLQIYLAATGTLRRISLNCTNPNLLPIVKDCSIIKEYCRFVEIVEKTYNKYSAKRSFKKAIELAMKEGILTDYLDRKSREVINMLCAKYNYKMDIAVKKQEAFEDGMNAGISKKAEEDAKNFIKMEILSDEQISQGTGLPLERVKELADEIR